MSDFEVIEDEDGEMWFAAGHVNARLFLWKVAYQILENYSAIEATEFVNTDFEPDRVKHCYWVEDPHAEEYGFWQSSPTRSDGLKVEPVTIFGSGYLVAEGEAWIPPAPCPTCHDRLRDPDDKIEHGPICTYVPVVDGLADRLISKTVHR